MLYFFGCISLWFYPTLGMDEKEFFKLVGERIRYIRKKKGFSQYDDFAWTNNLNRQTVLNAETGKPIHAKSLFKIIKALDETPEEFFKGIK
jgi:transcriptional regulator with XRE-family HTH domain